MKIFFCRKPKNSIQKNNERKQRIENFKLQILQGLKIADKSDQIFYSNHKNKALYFY
jgi:hypothetical protein